MKYTLKEYWNICKNHTLLRLGYTLENQQGHFLRLIRGKQTWTNPRRKKTYNCKHDSWKITSCGREYLDSLDWFSK